MAYCNWLSEQAMLAPAYDEYGNLLDKQGQITTNIKEVEGYRLLTEAEWEYAASGGHLAPEPRNLYSGSNNIDEVAWYEENSNVDETGRRTQPVGQKKPNELGIYDMSGNVWEWVHDWWTNGPYTDYPKTDPIGPLEEPFFYIEGNLVSGRVNRGGTWKDTTQHSRIAMREWDTLDRIYAATGFRIARTLFE